MEPTLSQMLATYEMMSALSRFLYQVVRLSTMDSPIARHDHLRAFVRFSLSQLRSRNEHHRFEHLCEALARQRITPNIVVGTGPVSAGGDQGRDFETFHGYARGHVRDLGVELGIEDRDAIVFCCTVGQSDVPSKIRRDISALTSVGSRVDVVVFFSEEDVPTAVRHRLIEEAAALHKVRLEIIDGQTLTGLLCDRDTFWIAVEFLDIPVHLTPDDAGPDWYASSRARWVPRMEGAVTTGDVIELATCVRFATFNQQFRGDINMWLSRLKPMLAEDVDPVLRRRARYETAVATYRGLGDLRPADELVRLALEEAARSESAEELYSAEILSQYARGAWLYAATDLTVDELDAFGQRMEYQLSRLSDSATVPDRRCLMLSLLGRTRLRLNMRSLAASGFQRGLVEPPPPMTATEWEEFFAHHGAQQHHPLPIVDRDGGFAAWREVVNVVEGAPLFPVQAFAETVALHTADLHDDPRWANLVAQLDAKVAELAGRRAAAALARTRSASLQAAGRPFAALAELHQARIALVTGDSRYEGAEALQDAADLYRSLGLLYAAKHYALAAGAVSSMEDGDHPNVAASLIAAAQCDYLAGNWFSFLSILPSALSAHLDLRGAVDEPDRWPDFAQMLDSLGILAKVVEQAEEPLLTRSLQTRLSKAGIALDDFANTAMYGVLPDDGREAINFVSSQVEQALFADTGRNRVIHFAARGVRWRIRTRNTFDEVRAAERLAAATQIIIATLGDEDLVLAETTVEIKVKTIRPKQGSQAVNRPPKPTGYASDGAHRWEVVLTRDLGPHSVEFISAANEVARAAALIILSVSLLPKSSFASVLGGAETGSSLLNALFPHIRYDRAYAVLPPEEFAEEERQSLRPLGPDGYGELLTSEYLSPIETPGPIFRGETPAERAAGRYPIYAQTLRITVPRLIADNRTRDVISGLRKEGWKDWHILMAISNLVINFRFTRSNEDPNDPNVRDRLMRWEPEDQSDEQIDLAMVTAESLREFLMASVPATADAYGLAPGMLSPAEILSVLATRYSYWKDDAEHEDPFRGVESLGGETAITALDE
jgi:hypothetical protein